MTFAEVAREAYNGVRLPDGMEPGLQFTRVFDPPNFTFPFGTHVAVVDVDLETGSVELVKYVSVDDCGNVVNPLLVDGQVQGGIAQGAAQALWEQIVYDKETGQLLTGSLLDYAAVSAEGLPMDGEPSHGHHHALQPARREGHRRGRHDRRRANGGQCGRRCPQPARGQARRHAGHLGARVEAHPVGVEERSGVLNRAR